MMESHLERFLVDELHTRKVRHSGRDFHTHLKGTHDLLKSWGNSPEICNVGLFHSVYGTASFKRRVVSLDRRHVVRGLIGPYAEHLVYVFCVTRRPAALLSLIGSSELTLLDRYSGRKILLSPDDLNRLLEVEAANLCEQGGRIADNLVKLLRSQISSAAKRHIGKLLMPAIANWPPQRGVWKAEVQNGLPCREEVPPSHRFASHS